MVFEESDAQLIRFWLFVLSPKEYVQKKSQGNTFLCRFLKDILCNTPRKDRRNT